MTTQAPYFPRPPSAFHDEAWRRLPMHDRMQQEVLALLRSRPLAAIPPGAAVHRRVEGELPMLRNGQIVGYADAAEIVTVNLFTTVNLFEIKPKIDTVFGIIRQAKALLALAHHCIPGDLHVCHVIVPHDDPHLAELRAEWPHTWAWGIEFAEAGEADE